MSVDEYWANHGKAFDPTLSVTEMNELLDWWLLYKSKASRNNSGRIPSSADEAISFLQEKLNKARGDGEPVAQHTTNVTTNTINVTAPFTGILQNGQHNQASSNTISPSEQSKGAIIKWVFDHISQIIVGVIVALILGWLGLGGNS